MGKLFKLKWYCQHCQKQCQDENGFRVHCSSYSHQAAVERFQANPAAQTSSWSADFENGFLGVARSMAVRQAATAPLQAAKLQALGIDGKVALELMNARWLDALSVYSEYIRDRHHVHLKGTRWTSVSGFVRSLGQRGLAEVQSVRPKTSNADDPQEDTNAWDYGSLEQGDTAETDADASEEDGLDGDPRKRPRWFIRLSDQSAAAVVSNRMRSAAAQSQAEEAVLMERQLARVEKVAREAAEAGPLNQGPVFVKRAEEVGCAKEAQSVAAVFDDQDAESVPASAVRPLKRSMQVLEELKDELPMKRVAASEYYAPIPPSGAVIDVSDSEEDSEEDLAEIPWLREGLLVRLANRDLANGRYFEHLAVIEKVVEEFGAQVAMLSLSGDQLLVDQDDCEAVSAHDGLLEDSSIAPKGGQVLARPRPNDCVVIVRPARLRGKTARLLKQQPGTGWEAKLVDRPGTLTLDPKQFCIFWEE